MNKMQPNILIVILLAAFILSCGIEENYFLPQVPEAYISRELNSDAMLIIPSIDQYYYALNYTIFYKIYISGHSTSGAIQSAEERRSISQDIATDYDVIFPSTDPTSTTTTAINTLFKNRNFFELELDGADIRELLPTSGSTMRLHFPSVPGYLPVANINGREFSLRRSSELISPEPDMFFRNSTELSDITKANSNINADVAVRSGIAIPYAYVSMYIVAIGLNPVGFTQIYSKPTHISIFRLPDIN